MEQDGDCFQWPSTGKRPLRVIIVGAGIGGLTAGIGEPATPFMDLKTSLTVASLQEGRP